MSAPADSAEGRWLARLRERRREGALHVAALEDVEALIAERDEARAEVERLRERLAVERTPNGAGKWNAERVLREKAERERDEARADFANACDVGRRQEARAEKAERERDEARAQVKAWQAEELARRTERDVARAEVERLRARYGEDDR